MNKADFYLEKIVLDLNAKIESELLLNQNIKTHGLLFPFRKEKEILLHDCYGEVAGIWDTDKHYPHVIYHTVSDSVFERSASEGWGSSVGYQEQPAFVLIIRSNNLLVHQQIQRFLKTIPEVIVRKHDWDAYAIVASQTGRMDQFNVEEFVSAITYTYNIESDCN